MSSSGCEVQHASGTLAVDEIVIASGAWTPQLAQLCDLNLSGEPVKGQMICLQAPPNLLKSYIHSTSAYIVPRVDQGYIIGATMVTSGFDRSSDEAAIHQLAAGAGACVPALAGAPIVEQWTGLRPRLANGRPLIDRIRPGLLVATGHFRNGVLLAPLTGDIIHDILMGGSPPDICRKDHHLDLSSSLI